ncbi:MAG: DUF5652 family protein [Candidatus Staskawiczbacteria bacterium]|nr:DUF5652 family protein [Candidatus Staskawiczbacteria bacterium]
MYGNYQQFINVMGFQSLAAGFTALILILVLWTAIWKGIALWKAARNGSKPWFIVLLVVNTLGILEIIYIFFFSKKKKQ